MAGCEEIPLGWGVSCVAHLRAKFAALSFCVDLSDRSVDRSDRLDKDSDGGSSVDVGSFPFDLWLHLL